MTQTVNVLSIDLSSASTAKASVVAVNGNTLSIVESHICDISENDLRLLSIAPSEEATSGDLTDTGGAALPHQLIQILRDIKSTWRSAVITLPARLGFSLNLSLPFADERQVQKILPLEVQDLVPFEIDDYHLAITTCSPANDDNIGMDLRVDLAEKLFLRGLLNSFQKQGIDPRIVSFPANSLSTILSLAPNYFSPNCALVWSTDASCTVIAVVGGVSRAARTIVIDRTSFDAREILREIKLFIGSVERRYIVSMDKLFLLGSLFRPDDAKQVIGREVEYLYSSDFLNNTSDDDAEILPSVLAYQATLPMTKIKANFRSGEFHFRPQFKELTAGLKSLTPYFIGFVVTSLLALTVIYFVNLSKISALEDAIQERIKRTIPNFSSPKGQEASAIARMTQQIEDQLKDLGSLATLSPLEAFLELSQDLPMNLGININEMSIKETRITVKGTAPDYATLDKVEQALKAKRDTYCAISIKDTAAGARSTSIGFEVTLQLC